MITWTQYFSYLVAGILYYMMIAAFFSVAAGYSTWAIIDIFLSLILGGYATGLSFIAPRSAAILGGVLSLLLAFYFVVMAVSWDGSLFALLFAIPALFAVWISLRVLTQAKESYWQQNTNRTSRLTQVIVISIPVLISTWLIVDILSRLIF